jgi:DNA-directed RNA polymerase subunit RPC12/RpoP
MSVNKQVVFKCRKCGYLMFIEDIGMSKIKKLLKLDCPECGEESNENWILSRIGDYQEEYGDKEE